MQELDCPSFMHKLQRIESNSSEKISIFNVVAVVGRPPMRDRRLSSCLFLCVFALWNANGADGNRAEEEQVDEQVDEEEDEEEDKGGVDDSTRAAPSNDDPAKAALFIHRFIVQFQPNIIQMKFSSILPRSMINKS